MAGAKVTKEAFDSFAAGREWTDVQGLGDAATFEPGTATLRVLKGSTLFTVSVTGHQDPLEPASALARRALGRLGEGPPEHAVS
ncbi:MAG: hypothetical protein M3N28_06545 [Actinomycetota bacterium]|nr:hypothetical protein [Actinomycetota bacterium]